jgi:hypothetical protein
MMATQGEKIVFIIVLVLAIVVGIFIMIGRLNRLVRIQRAAAIAAGADINAVSNWRCDGCGLKTTHRPELCIRCKRQTFTAY